MQYYFHIWAILRLASVDYLSSWELLRFSFFCVCWKVLVYNFVIWNIMSCDSKSCLQLIENNDFCYCFQQAVNLSKVRPNILPIFFYLCFWCLLRFQSISNSILAHPYFIIPYLKPENCFLNSISMVIPFSKLSKFYAYTAMGNTGLDTIGFKLKASFLQSFLLSFFPPPIYVTK